MNASAAYQQEARPAQAPQYSQQRPQARYQPRPAVQERPKYDPRERRSGSGEPSTSYRERSSPSYSPRQAPRNARPSQQQLPDYRGPPTQRQALVRKQQRPQPRYSPPSEDEITLSCEQVVQKQVITRVTGNSLGCISHMYIDPETLRVVSANLRARGLSVANPSTSNLLLETFCQIGDVVLVHDESVLDLVPQDDSVGFLNLIGCKVFTSQGDLLGRVRSYTFSPDSGRIDTIKYDRLGLNFVPEQLVGAWEAGVELIDNIDNKARITLLPGAEAELLRVSNGPLEFALVTLQKLLMEGSSTASSTSDSYVDKELETWRIRHGSYFLENYGQMPPSTREEIEAFYQGFANPAPPQKAAPAYLPPGRQRSMSSALQPAPVRETVQARRSQTDPRTRRQDLPRDPPAYDQAPAYQQPFQDSYQQYYQAPYQEPYPQGFEDPGPQFRPSASSQEGRGLYGQEDGYTQRNGARQADEQSGRKVASIPIIDRSTIPAHKQKDVDGGYGDPQAPQTANPDEKTAFADWMKPSADAELDTQYAGGNSSVQYTANSSNAASSQRGPSTSAVDEARFESQGGYPGGYEVVYDRPNGAAGNGTGQKEESRNTSPASSQGNGSNGSGGRASGYGV